MSDEEVVTTLEAMRWPTPSEWAALVPLEKWTLAALLLGEARQRRDPKSKVLTLNEQTALARIDDAMAAMGYGRLRIETSTEWTRLSTPPTIIDGEMAREGWSQPIGYEGTATLDSNPAPQEGE